MTRESVNHKEGGVDKVNKAVKLRIWLSLGATAVLGAALGCGEVGGSGQCGGVGDSGACIKIESIVPTYETGGGATSDVDAFMDVCTLDDPTTPEDETEFETITDHAAEVTFRNEPIPGAPSGSIAERDVTITQYTISYSLNNCPSGALCPALSTVNVSGESILIPKNSSVSRELKFIDLAKKQQYAELIGDNLFPPHGPASLQFPSYTATYTFQGTDIFNDPIILQGYTEFTIGDYDNCS